MQQRTCLRHNHFLLALLLLFTTSAVTLLRPNPALAALSRQESTPTQISLADFWKLVNETRLATVSDSSAGFSTLAQQWTDLRSVQLPDGTQLSISGEFIAAELRRDPVNRPQLEKLMIALQAEQVRWPARPAGENPLPALQEILARPEFDWTPAEPTWLDRLLEWLQERFWQLIADLLRFGGNTPSMFLVEWLLAGVVFFALLAAVIFFVRNLRRSLINEAQAGLSNPLDSEGLSASAARQKAETMAALGDLRQAVRYGYLSTLLLLEEQGLLRHDRTRTNHELLRSLSARPDLVALLDQAVDVFDHTWYGFVPLDAPAYSRYVQVIDSVWERLPSAARIKSEAKTG